MLLRSLISTGLLAVSLATLPAVAAPTEATTPHSMEMHHPEGKSAGTAATRAYKTAMTKMHKNMRKPLSGNPDIDFVRQMIPHHQGALDMARTQLRYGHDEKLKKFNKWVIFAQEVEIAGMENWLRRRDNGAAPQGAKDYYGEAMAKMHHDMMMDYTGDADVDYVHGMIAHHQGAVDMARIWLADGSDPDLKRLANNIYSSQTQEIAWLQNWLAANHK